MENILIEKEEFNYSSFFLRYQEPRPKSKGCYLNNIVKTDLEYFEHFRSSGFWTLVETKAS